MGDRLVAATTYAGVYGFAPLLAAFHRARRAKRGRGGEPAFYLDLEGNLLRLSGDLRERTYRPDPYRFFPLFHRKERIVSEASFRDRVVHHSLVAATEPVFEDGFIHHSYACRKGRGAHAAVRRARRLCGAYRYYLRMDVQGYFDHVDHAVLLDLLSRRIHDPGILWLCRALLDGARVPTVPADERRGIPIGNLTSQFWANVYLDPLDQMVTRDLGQGTYSRYMDDILVLGDRKRALWEVCAEITRLLRDRLRLRAKEAATVVAPVTEGIPWLGFRVFPCLTRVDRRGRRRFGRKIAASLGRSTMGPAGEDAEVASAASLCGHLVQANTRSLRRSIFDRLDARGPDR